MATAWALRSLDVIVTSDCNLRCAYCYQDAKTPGLMTWGVLRPALDLLLGSPRSCVTLLFIGGEPLLGFPLIRQAVRYVESRRRRDLDVEFAIATNGTLVGRAEADFFAHHDFDLQVSLDGGGDVQQLRGAGAGAAIEVLFERLRRDHPAYFARRLSVGTTLLARTVPRLSESVDYLLAMGVPELAMVPALTHQPDWRPERIDELTEQFAEAYRSSLRYYRRTGLVPLQLFRRGAGPRRRRASRAWLCGSGRGEALAIDVDGNLLGCVLFARSYQRLPDTTLGRAIDTLRLGTARSPELARRIGEYSSLLEATGLFDRRDRKYSSYGQCASCRIRRECSTCPICIVHLPGNEDPHRIPDFVCAFNRVAAAFRSRFPSQADAHALMTGSARVPAPVRRVLTLAATLGDTHEHSSRRQ